MAVAYVLDDVFANHCPPSAHPERPERIVAVRDALRAAGLPARGTALPVRRATEDEVGRVHTAAYVGDLSQKIPGKSGWLDADTYFSPGSWDAALTAAGAAIDVSLATLSGEFKRGLALVRPPGHHAEADRAMGFCLINNVAAAAAAVRAAGAAKVAIVDWDVHHGNGTQHMFEDDPDVLYLSCHQYPFYPGSGAPTEVGTGDGIGATVNVALPAGCGDADYQAVFHEIFAPEIRRFAPNLVLVSAGFDAYVDDPLAGMRVTQSGYRALATSACAVADEVAEGRVVCVLEGGYDLDGLGGGIVAVLDALAPGTQAPDPVAGDSGAARDAIEATRAALSRARGAA